MLIRLTAPRIHQRRQGFHRQYCPDHRPRPTLGVIYAPALGVLWAGYGETAWMRHIDTPSADAAIEDFSTAPHARC